ncbi:11645_t:CDS:2, partial [Ambispora gerdemannii]
ISHGSEHDLVELIGHFIEAAVHELPIECQGSVGDRPDLMIRAFLRHRWEEIAYLESEKLKTNDNKIFDDHKKLIQLCLDGYTEISKKCQKEHFSENFISLGINIAVKIPFDTESIEEVKNFVHLLLTLR